MTKSMKGLMRLRDVMQKVIVNAEQRMYMLTHSTSDTSSRNCELYYISFRPDASATDHSVGTIDVP
jgi:hypothetical protein